MSELQSRNRQPSRPRTVAANCDSRLQLIATYGAFVLIAGIVFGTLPFRPF